MICLPTAKEVAGYTNRYAAALYYLGGGRGYPPRQGLVQNRPYTGQILEGGRFHVLQPDRMCFLSEFLDFQLVSRRWSALCELERSLLVATYSQKKLALDRLSTDLSSARWSEIATQLERAGYVRWAESRTVELTPVGEAEVQDRIFNLAAGHRLIGAQGGIRVRHHSVTDHELDLGCTSTLSINVEGMRIRVFTLQGGGAVIRVDPDASHRVYMCHHDDDRNFAQAYVDREDTALHEERVRPRERDLDSAAGRGEK